MPDGVVQQEFGNAIPPAVRRAARRADEAARAAGVMNVPEVVDEVLNQPIVEHVAAEAPPVEPVAEPLAAEPVVEWEQRYRTLQGKYDSELPQLRGQVASLERLIANMQPMSREPTPVPAHTNGAATATIIPPEDVEAYGEELITAARGWARAELQPRIDALEQKFGQLEGGQREIQTLTAQQRVQMALDADPALSGKWRQLNNDPDFIAWTQQVDPFSGQVRQNLLGDAYARGDAARTGRFFTTYLAEHTAVAVAALPAVHTPGSGAGRPTLEDMAAPGRATGQVAGGAPVEKRIWTNRDIQAFYRDRAAGRWAGREQEAARMEQDLFAAMPEGRVRP